MINQLEPAHEKRVLIIQAASKGSDEPAHKRSLVRAFAVNRNVAETLRKLEAGNACLAQIGDCLCAFEDPHTGKR